MNERTLRVVASICLVGGGILGMVGSFVPSSLRGIAWGIDGTLLIVGAAILTIHYIKNSNEHLASAFLVFLAGQTLVVSGSAIGLSESAPSFGAGVGLWAASLALICTSSFFPVVLRFFAGLSSVLFAITAIQIYGFSELNPLSKPLPFFAYPIFVITLFGLAWVHLQNSSKKA